MCAPYIECVTYSKTTSTCFFHLMLSFVSHSIISSQLASVAFQFRRSGFVKVVLDKGEDFDDRLEALAEAAFGVGAEDFFVENDKASSDSVEIKVGRLLYSCPSGSLSLPSSNVHQPCWRL